MLSFSYCWGFPFSRVLKEERSEKSRDATGVFVDTQLVSSLLLLNMDRLLNLCLILKTNSKFTQIQSKLHSLAFLFSSNWKTSDWQISFHPKANSMGSRCTVFSSSSREKFNYCGVSKNKNLNPPLAWGHACLSGAKKRLLWSCVEFFYTYMNMTSEDCWPRLFFYGYIDSDSAFLPVYSNSVKRPSLGDP